jgi:hypothetical protein
VARPTLFKRHVALPADHGSWAFFAGPLIVGLFAGDAWNLPAFYLTVAAASGFLIRQPVTLIVKVIARRRSRDVLPAAWFWVAVYGGLAALHVTGLVLRGFGYVLYLALPGVAVFAWFLGLVYRKDERRQWLVEIVATGVMALAAPAAMWVGLGHPDVSGWLLWLLLWAQSAAGILYAYLRLEQRRLPAVPGVGSRLRMAAAPLAAGSLGVVLAVALGLAELTPRWLFVAYAFQLGEIVRGALRPAIGVRPTAIGFRQLAVTVVFTVLFVVGWKI